MNQETDQQFAHKIPHYYGDWVRRLFILAGVILLIALPLFEDFLPVPTLITSFIIVLLIVFAAMTNPMLRIVNRINVVTSIVALVLFEHYAVESYKVGEVQLAIVHQVLAIVFFFALYLSMKTFRAMATGQINAEEVAKTAQLPPEEESHESMAERILGEDDKSHY